jgi:hypothetical protein
MAHLRPRVITGRPARRAGSEALGFTPPEDSYLSKVIKYIPAETIAGYQAGIGIIPEVSQLSVTPYFSIFLLIFTPLWVLFATKEPNEPWARYQSMVSIAAFLIWLFAINSPFWSWALSVLRIVDRPIQAPGYIRSLVLIGATMAFPLVEKILKSLVFDFR